MKLSDISFVKADSITTAPKLNITFNRIGNMSIYGDLKVDHISPSGKTVQAKIIKGIGVYTPTPRRRMSIDLDTDNSINYKKGKLHITYTLQNSDKSDKTVRKVEEDVVISE